MKFLRTIAYSIIALCVAGCVIILTYSGKKNSGENNSKDVVVKDGEISISEVMEAASAIISDAKEDFITAVSSVNEELNSEELVAKENTTGEISYSEIVELQEEQAVLAQKLAVEAASVSKAAESASSASSTDTSVSVSTSASTDTSASVSTSASTDTSASVSTSASTSTSTSESASTSTVASTSASTEASTTSSVVRAEDFDYVIDKLTGRIHRVGCILEPQGEAAMYYKTLKAAIEAGGTEKCTVCSP